MKNRVDSPPGRDLSRIRETRTRLDSMLDRVRASANPLDPTLLRELRLFLEMEALPAALEYERILGTGGGPGATAADHCTG